jgi:hypothetical protein
MNVPIAGNPARPNRTGPIVLIVASLVVGALAGWAFVTGVIDTVGTVGDAIDTASDPTRDVRALTALPGDATTELAAGRYQVVALGPQLTSTRSNPGGVIERDVVVNPFGAPTFTIDGPDGAVRVTSPSVQQLVDGPGGDLVAIGEFTAVRTGAYTLHVGGESTAVTAVGINKRPDLGGAIRSSVTNTGKIMLGVLLGVVSVGMLIGGLIWLSIRRRGAAAPIFVGGQPWPPAGAQPGSPPVPRSTPVPPVDRWNPP